MPRAEPRRPVPIDRRMIEPSPSNDSLYDRLIRLRPEGLSTRAWTINAGVSSRFFDNLAAGGTIPDGELPKILAVVGMTLAEFEGRGRRSSPAAALPTLRVMPREPRPAAETAPPPSPATAPAPSDAAGTDAAGREPPVHAAATAEAIARWREARRQAAAAGLDTDGVEGARLVLDLARLALDVERAAPRGSDGAGTGLPDA